MTIFDAVQLELTNKCQLDCAECPRRLMTRPIGDMDFDLATLIADDAFEINPDPSIVVNGLGDPILYPRLAEFFEHIAKRKPGVKIEFFTNLSVPPLRVKALFHTINSIDCKILVATTKHVYDGKGARAAAVTKFYDENLRLVADLCRGKKHVDLHAHMVINKFHTQAEIDAFFAEFTPVLPEGHVHISKQLNPWFDLVSEMAGADGVDPGQMQRPSTGLELCHYPFKTAHVGWDGEMIICCTDDVDQECTFGKIRERGDLARLWNGPALDAIREQFNRMFDDKLDTAPKPCQKCFRLNWLRQPVAV